MSNKTSNLVKLAKGNRKNSTTPVAKKPVVVKEVEKPKTPEEVRDFKAKQRVEELLSGVELTPKKEELLELESEEPKEGVDWLEEQVSLLSEQNEHLRSELSVTKADYAKLFDDMQRLKSGGNVDDGTKTKVVELFNELQNAHLTMGYNPSTNAPNLIIAPVAFMNRLIMFFPFLQGLKRF
jgi:hypothetical protein